MVNADINTTKGKNGRKLIKVLYALTMIGAAAIILILFENLAPLNIYFIYLSMGVILGLGVVILLDLIVNREK